jgi:hypothetical protein
LPSSSCPLPMREAAFAADRPVATAMLHRTYGRGEGRRGAIAGRAGPGRIAAAGATFLRFVQRTGAHNLPPLALRRVRSLAQHLAPVRRGFFFLRRAPGPPHGPSAQIFLP